MIGHETSCSAPGSFREFVNDKILLGMRPRDYARSLVTPFNFITGMIVAVGLPLIALRFIYGIGATTNLDQRVPWGVWIGLDVMVGVALAAGGYTVAVIVHVLGLEKYRSVFRPAILTGFVGYVFVVLGVLIDLGRPWRIPYPIIYPRGVASSMFIVAWAEFLYVFVQFVLFCPAIFEWLGWKNVRAFFNRITLPVTILGAILSTLHQSALGGLMLIAPSKMHPLWYTPYLPVLFFISSIGAGCTMVIFEGSLVHRIFHSKVDPAGHELFDRITLGLGKAGAVVLFTYFFLRLIGLAETGRWDLVWSPLGHVFLVELIGFVALPAALLTQGVRQESTRMVRWGAVLAVLGIVVNRINVAVTAFNWNIPDRYIPSWMEVMTSLTLITLGVLTFRWIVNRMPVLHEAGPEVAR